MPHCHCGKRAIFGLPDDDKPSCCKAHAKESMIDLKNKKCLKEDCNKQPVFGLPTDKRPTYCSKHKKEGMVDLKNRRCLEEGCNTQPVFGLPTDKRPTYCSKHIKEGMVDLRNNRCLEEGCDIQASFGFIDNRKRLYCSIHKKEGMVHLSEIKAPKHICSQCDAIATVKIDKHYCDDHIPHCLLAEIKRLCKHCENDYNLKYECDDCKKRKTIRKETFVVKHLHNNIRKEATSLDQRVGECSKRRPDVYYDCDTHGVIVEVDEFQHRSYNESCECARLNEICNDLGGLPLHIIRYNPDNFKINNRKYNITREKRLEYLVELLKKCIDVKPKNYIILHQMFYDSYEGLINQQDITDMVTV